MSATAPQRQWWESDENVTDLVRYLNEHDYFDRSDRTTKEIVDSVLYVIEKPYKYDNEWRRKGLGLEPDEELCMKCRRPGDAFFIQKYGMCSFCDSTSEGE